MLRACNSVTTNDGATSGGKNKGIFSSPAVVACEFVVVGMANANWPALRGSILIPGFDFVEPGRMFTCKIASRPPIPSYTAANHSPIDSA
jgi:hypothetical protein